MMRVWLLSHASVMIADRYRLQARIVAGGMGEVSQAAHLLLG
jgi:hypothetical protein